MPPGVYVKTAEHLEKLRAAAMLRRGAGNPSWKGGRVASQKSPYVYINVGPDQYQLEHVLVAERVLGRRMPQGAVVHHVDGNGHNNATSNLVICESNSYHRTIHRRLRVLKAGGNPNTDRICSTCRTVFPVRSVNYRCLSCGRISDRAQRAKKRAA